MTLAVIILALVTLQRLGELVLADNHTHRLMAVGGIEKGPEHYPIMVLMHAAWLVGLWVLAWDRSVNWGWLAVFVVLQALRVWVIATLGVRWTTRIIILPGAALVRNGPYRFLSHPNYIVVAAEIAVLPLTFGLWGYALIFSLLNLAMMAVRLRAENEALSGAPGFGAAKLELSQSTWASPTAPLNPLNGQSADPRSHGTPG
jgi:methyltransferase